MPIFTVNAEYYYDNDNVSSSYKLLKLQQSWARDNTAATMFYHVFRPQSCWLLHYYYIVLATPSRHRDLNIFRM